MSILPLLRVVYPIYMLVRFAYVSAAAHENNLPCTRLLFLIAHIYNPPLPPYNHIEIVDFACTHAAEHVKQPYTGNIMVEPVKLGFFLFFWGQIAYDLR